MFIFHWSGGRRLPAAAGCIGRWAARRGSWFTVCIVDRWLGCAFTFFRRVSARSGRGRCLRWQRASWARCSWEAAFALKGFLGCGRQAERPGATARRRTTAFRECRWTRTVPQQTVNLIRIGPSTACFVCPVNLVMTHLQPSGGQDLHQFILAPQVL